MNVCEQNTFSELNDFKRDRIEIKMFSFKRRGVYLRNEKVVCHFCTFADFENLLIGSLLDLNFLNNRDYPNMKTNKM